MERNDQGNTIVHIIDNNTLKVISGYSTKTGNEHLKMFITVYENNIECNLNQFDSSINDSYKDTTFRIEDIMFQLPTQEGFPAIDVYVKE